jgi:alanine-glyoxylate transaminase/serine-glyoxylate transaminase/serine-pyruvate transaminase
VAKTRAFMDNLVMNDPREPLRTPERLLCGPGPSNVDPRVLEVMHQPMLGHLDPDFHRILENLVELLQGVYRRDDGLTLALSASGTSGMEAGIASLVEPGETVIVAAAGFFGNRIVEMAQRYGANVVDLRAPFGQTVPNDQILDELARRPETRLVAVVHAETSTGVGHPLGELAEAMRGSDALLMADCVTSLGSMELEPQRWGVDYCYSCSQKCLGAPPGISPVTLSPAAMERIGRRTHPVPFSFDFELLAKYWIDRPVVYHHTVPSLQYYALYEGVRLALEEGMEARWARHAEAGARFQDGMRERGFALLAEPELQLAALSAVRVPEDIDGKEIQHRLLREHNIEVGGGLGPDAPPIWRIGLMGVNARVETADRMLEAFDAVLAPERSSVAMGGGGATA